MDDNFMQPHLDAEDSPEYLKEEARQLIGQPLIDFPELQYVSLAALMAVFQSGFTHCRQVVVQSQEDLGVPF